jgi:sugar O-acyltransferase (sialic acid O-acetyltransferase NeuD family)
VTGAKKLVIFGAGDIAKLAHFYFTRDVGRDVVAFTVDRAYRKDDRFLGLPLHDFESILDRCPPRDHDLFVAVSYTHMNRTRAERYETAKTMGYELPSYVSRHCSYLSDAPPGENCFILEDNTIQPFARIGNNVTLWSGNHVGHEVVIEDHCFVSSHVVIAGHVRVGAYSFLGVNATLRHAITIAPRTLVGAGAVITRDTVEGGVYVPPRTVLLDKRSDEIRP